MLNKLLTWWRQSISEFPRPLSNHDLRAYGIRSNVFFRLDSGFLREAEITTTNDDVPLGVPILHWICYQFQQPWQLHEIITSVWQSSLIAKIGVSKEILFQSYFTEWDDGWMLCIEPTQIATRDQIHDFIARTNEIAKSIPSVRDVRWFYDETLTCGCFHESDFELGTESPFG